MENKQTAVDWLIEQIIKYELAPKGTNKDNVLFHKAKQMEKEQIKDAFDKGYSYYLFNGGGEQYYNETYENNSNKS